VKMRSVVGRVQGQDGAQVKFAFKVAWAALGAFAFAACGGDSGATTDAPGGVPSDPFEPPAMADPGTIVAQHGQLRVEGRRLVGSGGEPVQLKGMSSMWLNWDNAGFAQDKEGLRWMRDNWGLTVFRAAMGITEAGSYLNGGREQMEAKVRRVVENAIELGLYVIIDWHDHDAEDHPADAAEFFGRMAADYGSYPNVLYETYNEPLQVSWSEVLKPYHTEVLAAIRAQDADNIVILGTPQWSQRVDQAAADRVEGDNLMYTVHFYACEHRAQIRQFAATAFNMGVPMFVTEWGATAADGGRDRNGQVCAADADEWHTFMNLTGLSWAAWKLDGCTDLSCMFTSRTAPTSGGWTAESGILNGHANYVIEKMLAPAATPPL
jgi:endoglucanase